MDGFQIFWDLDDDPEGNVQHILEHDVTVEEAEEVLFGLRSIRSESRSSGEEITFGYTSGGRYLAVVWNIIEEDPLIIRPITAYEASEPKSKKRRP